MKQLKYNTIIGIIFVLATGTLAHFFYQWSGKNRIVGLFTPINESIWEHMKLLFFPMLLYAVYLVLKFRAQYPCIAVSLCFGILAGTLLLPVFYYAYTTLLGRNVFVLDIALFVLCILIAFGSSYQLTLHCSLENDQTHRNYRLLLYLCICVLFVSFIIFSYYPPDLIIFKDPNTL